MIIALDTESTGFLNNPKTGHPDIIEMSYIPVTEDTFNFNSPFYPSKIESRIQELKALATTQRYLPDMPIDPRATEVHGITRRDLVGMPKTRTLSLPEGTTSIICHNAAWDYRCLGKPEGISTLCTRLLSSKLTKTTSINPPSCRLTYLITYFYKEKAESAISKAHSAEMDTIMVILLLDALIPYLPDIDSIESLLKV